MRRFVAALLVLACTFGVAARALAARVQSGGSSYSGFVAASPATAMPLTMCCFAILPNTTTPYALMSLNKAADAGFSMYLLEVSGTGFGLTPVMYPPSPGTFVYADTGSGSYSASVWTHFACAFSATNSRTAYVNGGSANTTTTSATAPNAPDEIYLGSQRSGLGQFQTSLNGGTLGPCTVYTVALEAGAIANLAAGQSPLRGPHAEALVFYAEVSGDWDGTVERDTVGKLGMTTSGSTRTTRKPGLIFGGMR